MSDLLDLFAKTSVLQSNGRISSLHGFDDWPWDHYPIGRQMTHPLLSLRDTDDFANESNKWQSPLRKIIGATRYPAWHPA